MFLIVYSTDISFVILVPIWEVMTWTTYHANCKTTVYVHICYTCIIIQEIVLKDQFVARSQNIFSYLKPKTTQWLRTAETGRYLILILNIFTIRITGLSAAALNIDDLYLTSRKYFLSARARTLNFHSLRVFL